MDDDAYLENFFAMERWANDNIPVAGETFREFVKHLYQQNQLVMGELRLNDTPVKLQNITCPLLTLVAEQDHLVPPNSTWPFEHYVSSKFIQPHVDQRRAHRTGRELEGTQTALAGCGDVDCRSFDQRRANAALNRTRGLV